MRGLKELLAQKVFSTCIIYPELFFFMFEGIYTAWRRCLKAMSCLGYKASFFRLVSMLLTVAQLLGQISNDKCGYNWLGHNNGIKFKYELRNQDIQVLKITQWSLVAPKRIYDITEVKSALWFVITCLKIGRSYSYWKVSTLVWIPWSSPTCLFLFLLTFYCFLA